MLPAHRLCRGIARLRLSSSSSRPLTRLLASPPLVSHPLLLGGTISSSGKLPPALLRELSRCPLPTNWDRRVTTPRCRWRRWRSRAIARSGCRSVSWYQADADFRRSTAAAEVWDFDRLRTTGNLLFAQLPEKFVESLCRYFATLVVIYERWRLITRASFPRDRRDLRTSWC